VLLRPIILNLQNKNQAIERLVNMTEFHLIEHNVVVALSQIFDTGQSAAEHHAAIVFAGSWGAA